MRLEQPIIRVEGPPPGLPAGRYDVPRWVIAAVGAAIVLVGVVYLVARIARRRKPAP